MGANSGGMYTYENGRLVEDPLLGTYNTYIDSLLYTPLYGGGGDPTSGMSFSEFKALYNALGGIIPSNQQTIPTGSITRGTKPTGSNSVPAMTGANSSADLYNKYRPAPFTLEANTPKVMPQMRGLTYNNPYNTNPYLPTANPFALIANSPTSGS